MLYNCCYFGKLNLKNIKIDATSLELNFPRVYVKSFFYQFGFV